MKEVSILLSNLDINYIDFFLLGDDYGTQKGPILNPAIWKKFIKPRLQKLVSYIRSRGIPVALHSCGNVTPLISDFIEIGISILNPVQPRAMDLKFLKKEFGDKLCFFGTIDTQQTLPHGTPRDVESEVRIRIKEMGYNGGLILAPSQDLLPDVPDDNIFAFVNACKKYGSYYDDR